MVGTEFRAGPRYGGCKIHLPSSLPIYTTLNIFQLTSKIWSHPLEKNFCRNTWILVLNEFFVQRRMRDIAAADDFHLVLFLNSTHSNKQIRKYCSCICISYITFDSPTCIPPATAAAVSPSRMNEKGKTVGRDEVILTLSGKIYRSTYVTCNSACAPAVALVTRCASSLSLSISRYINKGAYINEDVSPSTRTY